jgi:methylenetetrahydrofolate reductase (NADPH)
MSNSKTFSEIFASNKKTISFEFFPPKNAQQEQLLQATVRELAEFNPDFISITHSAGENSVDFELNAIDLVNQNVPQATVVAHLTGINYQLQEIDLILRQFCQRQVGNILVLRGDEPTLKQNGDCCFNQACELVAHIKQTQGFSLAVAGYPEGHYQAVSLDTDIEFLKQKVDCGAELIITQFFLDTELFFRFLEKTKKAGICVPILPGINLINDYVRLQSFAQKCKVHIPDKLLNRLERIKDNQVDIAKFGVDFVIQMSKNLLSGGAVGLHFFTLNRFEQVKSVLEEL